MKKTIRLTDVEQEMRRLLIKIAAGVESCIVRKKKGIAILKDFDEFRARFQLSKEQLAESLEHISIYDTYTNSNAPLLEMLLEDITGHFLGCPVERESTNKLLDEYETYWPDKEKCNSVYWRLIEYYPNRLESYALRKTFEESIEKERVRAEWYWRVNRSIPDRLTQSINKEHIVADIDLLRQWTDEDIAAIAMRTIAQGKYIKLRIRYILFGEKPTFHYAHYGDFFFQGSRLYVIVKQQDEYTPFRNKHVEKWLQAQSEKAPISTDKSFSIDCSRIACQTMEKRNDIVIEAVFAGVRTNMTDSKTHEPIYTGDIIAVKGDNGSCPAQTINAMTNAVPPHYVLPLDNHAFDLTPEMHNQKYYKAGTSFFNLSRYIELNEVSRWFDGVLSMWGEPSATDKKILRAKMKAAPCYEQEDWEWLASIKTGTYNNLIDMEVEKSKQSEKARLGAIGENNVVSKIMEHGWDAFNANCTIKNYKSIDIMCVKKDEQSYKPMVSFVQVKTSVQKNIPIGFTLEDCLNDTLEKKVMGPYVFVYADNSKQPWSFRYFIISRKQFIELARQAHEYYVTGYHREKEVSLKSPAALCLRWLEGSSDKATTRHIAFNNPLQGVSCEDKWDNIWDE